jgi:hypothetical protein
VDKKEQTGETAATGRKRSADKERPQEMGSGEAAARGKNKIVVIRL